MAKSLAEALNGLDPNNDNHWTSDGSPRLETVRMLAGNPAVTREQVTAAAPGLSRATAGAQGAQPASLGGSTTQAAPEAPAAVQGPSQGSGDGDQGGGADGVDADPAEEAGSEGGEDELAAAQAALSDAVAVQAEATRRVRAAQAEVDRLLQEEAARRPPAHVVNALSVQQYLARQRANLQEQGAKREALRGVDLKALLPQRAPIDTALARRNTRGNQRPAKV